MVGSSINSDASTTSARAPASSSAATASRSRFVPGPAMTIAGTAAHQDVAPGERGDEPSDLDRADAVDGEGRGVGHVSEQGRVAVHLLDERVDVGRVDLHDEAADRLAEQRSGDVVMGQGLDRRSEAPADAHLGDRDRETALAQVVARANDAGADRPMESPVPLRRTRRRAQGPDRRRRRVAAGPCRGATRRTRLGWRRPGAAHFRAP